MTDTTTQAAPFAPIHDPSVRGFASDNYAGIHPEVLAALVAANGGHQVAYGEDVYTARLTDVLAEVFGTAAQVYPVFNGTGANVLALQACTPRWGSVLTTTSAHIHVDEAAAPERVGGLKVNVVDTPDGKLTPELIRAYPARVGDEHFAQVGVVSITNSTEIGTVYTPTEIRAIADVVHDMGWVLHLDGSRLSNAAAALGVELRELTTDAGVDILSLGGTKIGAMLAEAVVVLSPDRVTGATFLRKQSMQLASKMRFVSAQLLALFEGDLWRRNAEHANAMARRLAEGVAGVEGLTLPHEVEANAVFPILARESSERLMESFRFYFWDERTGQVRWMCSWDTTEGDVDAFVEAVRAELSR
ncbi:aromatic amino acid beta-eliminating lyase/threonine aldolase [Janibacter hoylei PVAS-1]|uniref:Aromatic amino acid beta-eliminating lyase/threonine aldolase n=1 Tax=Janibacter hoylei PVAS-1 TaxID=1210046 RepID=K1E4Q0_9MICO|nr:low specificity L-threonine aldolase [Janibacter hoylei]EKA60327.1 aromatic amino acid beta-eliminating lyase/threonine aldolase [Janibacter hoylei PVAS-1]RWU81910.1 low specificity L-threonine aldolase [Janibacter hoylei PVAS-1]